MTCKSQILAAKLDRRLPSPHKERIVSLPDHPVWYQYSELAMTTFDLLFDQQYHGRNIAITEEGKIAQRGIKK